MEQQEAKDQEQKSQEQETSKPKEESIGFMTALICGIIILGFAGWIVWMALGGDDASKSPKRLTEAQVRKSVEQAEQADPELKKILLMKSTGHVKTSTAPSIKVDINSASEEQLKKITALTEWDINAIIKMRPYKSTDELLSKKALGETRYNDVVSFLSVSQAN